MGWQVRQDGSRWRRVVPSRSRPGCWTCPPSGCCAVQDGYGTPQARPIRRATPAELRARAFPAGSMGPKVESVCRFVDATGQPAAIGRLGDAQALLAGQAGTLIAR